MVASQRETSKAEAVEEVVARVHERLSGDGDGERPPGALPESPSGRPAAGADRDPKLVEKLVRQIYTDVPPEDIRARGVLDLYGAALALWELVAERQPGEVKARLYSPRLDDHGWDCNHTVLQIVCADMPFLVDSVTMELNRHGLATHLVIHPVIKVRRDERGHLTDILPLEDESDAAAESLMHVEVDRQTDPELLARVQHAVVRVLGDVRAAVEDWEPMRSQVDEVVRELTEQPPPVDPDELEEAVAFLRWLAENHFTFLGYRTYDLTVEDDHEVELHSVPESGLGILRPGRTPQSRAAGALPVDDLDGTPPAGQTVRRLTGEPAELARASHVLVLTKANTRSTVHVPAYLDYVGVRRFDAGGEVVGEWRFLGLYTSAVYNNSPRDVPILRRRIQRVLDWAGYAPHSHNEKALLDVLETHPRDELLQTSSAELFDIAMGVLRLKDRPRVALFIRPDPYKRFLSCLVYVPRERYNTTVREAIEHVLTSAFDGRAVDYSVRVSESALARLHVILRTQAGRPDPDDLAEVSDRLVRATRSWTDDLRTELLEQCDEEAGNRLFRTYEQAFPAAYREDFPARNAVADIQRLEALTAQQASGGPSQVPGMSLYHPLEAAAGTLRFKLFWRERSPMLSDVLPVLEQMGVRIADERPYEVHAQGQTSWIHDFGLVTTDLHHDWSRRAEEVKATFQAAFAHVWNGDAESDGFNRLVLSANLSWREVTVLRAYAKYLRQAGMTFSQTYMERTLTANREVARLLVELFKARFDPGRDADGRAAAEEITKLIDVAVDDVASLDQDRILRGFLTAINATVRTNYYQRSGDGAAKPWLSLKLDSHQIALLPHPRPVAEIFVYSPRVEGVHLRGARVARGGIRWSDRQEDFRTEVLGLMKAQTVKNAVIVPGGAKGGFVVKQLAPGIGREAVMAEVRASYSTFIRGLLDLTDNYMPDPDPTDDVPPEIVSPPDVVCHDALDPYLVVAADKGTASFSDLANEIAEEYGYWLGDAFASGGSAGYDHKGMGITARGAWESVRWHFHEMGVDPQTEEFTAVGIGDMAGDVFGNGMLQSSSLKLVAAFNHQHIFLDPDPDPEAGFQERRRLFELPRSTWADYDRTKLSEGGGIFERTAKAIPLSPEVRRVLAVEDETLTPHQLIRAILLAPVDLLFNGGIGTYVKASGEVNADVGDRANDGLRVDGNQLRCRVVGEGGNLGFTQLGRIEYALHGGRINTDFIDNSAGVDTSDHEVNIKILLNEVVATGDMTVKQRNELLAEMTGEVTNLVLRNNYRQAESISVSESTAPRMLEQHAHVLRAMERAGVLNRAREFLPDRKTLAERRAAGAGLTRPELAVLLAYGKIAMEHELLDSDVPEDPYLAGELERYLPTPLRRFRAQMRRHRLHREIIATHITNSMVNRVGATFPYAVGEETGAAAPDIARAYTVAREVFSLRALWSDIEALDAGVPGPDGLRRVHANVQTAMLRDGRRLAERATVWLLRNRRQPLDVAGEVHTLTPVADAVIEQLGTLLVGSAAEYYLQRVERLTAQEVPESLARRVAGLGALLGALDISEVATSSGRPVEEVAAVYFQINTRLEVDWLRRQVSDDVVRTESHWHELAWASLREDVNTQHRNITARVLQETAHYWPVAGSRPVIDNNRGSLTGHRDVDPNSKVSLPGHTDRDPAALVDAWVEGHRLSLQRCLDTIGELKSSDVVDLAMASVGLRELRRLAQTVAA